MLLILDRQHGDKGKGYTPGAHADIDGDGKLETWEQEAQLTPVYIGHAVDAALRLGISTKVIEAGSYTERHRLANQTARGTDGPVAYIACHYNAGGGDYGAAFYDVRSPAGAALAAHIAIALQDRLGIRVRAIQARTDDWTKAARYTIAGIYAGPANISGICLEPLFMDNPTHQALILGEGPLLIGEAIARGLDVWREGR